MSDLTHFVSLASNSGAGTSWKLSVECMTKMNKQASQQVKTKKELHSTEPTTVLSVDDPGLKLKLGLQQKKPAKQIRGTGRWLPSLSLWETNSGLS